MYTLPSLNIPSKFENAYYDFDGKCKYFSSIKLVSFRKLALSHNMTTNQSLQSLEGASACQPENKGKILAWVV